MLELWKLNPTFQNRAAESKLGAVLTERASRSSIKSVKSNCRASIAEPFGVELPSWHLHLFRPYMYRYMMAIGRRYDGKAVAGALRRQIDLPGVGPCSC